MTRHRQSLVITVEVIEPASQNFSNLAVLPQYPHRSMANRDPGHCDERH
jgi:hypothetical protein